MTQAYERVKIARSIKRPTGLDFINGIFTDFTEFHGDKSYGDDGAIVAGIAFLKDMAVTVIAIEKGHDTREKVARNFGCAHPEGYKKALRQMKLAEKFSRPIVCLIDTAGAYCGIGAEQRGQGYAIANNLMEMMTLKTPILSILIGEGGSGGALGLAVADEVWMLQNSVYSVISAEGCASILWKDAKRADEAAQHLKLTAKDLRALGVIEKIISEEKGSFKTVYDNLQTAIYDTLQKNFGIKREKLLENRYNRFRKIGSSH